MSEIYNGSAAKEGLLPVIPYKKYLVFSEIISE